MDNRIIVSEEQVFDLRFWKRALLMNTSIPAIINAFDPTTQRVSATPAIKAQYTSLDLEISYIDCPMITNIPLAVHRGNGLIITHPVEVGKLCTLIFSQRSIDNLLLDGTRAAQPFNGTGDFTSRLRCMDMTDAMCFPGIITNTDTISNYNNNAVELRTDDGKVKVSVDKNSLTLVQDSASILLSNGNIAMQGATIDITGTTAVNISSPNTTLGTVTTIDNKPFLTHIHSGGTIQGKTGGVE